MRVWIDQRECVGNGVCVDLCPDVFGIDGGIAYVHVGGRRLPDGPDGAAPVPEGRIDAVVEAAEECPAACIYVEED
jgi:ferredoxin